MDPLPPPHSDKLRSSRLTPRVNTGWRRVSGGTMVRGVVTLIAPLSLLMIATAPASFATTSAPASSAPTSITVSSSAGSAYSSRLTVSFPAGSVNTSKLNTIRSLLATSQKPATVSPPVNATISCLHGTYYFPDSNGTFTVQNSCLFMTFPWGYKLSSALQSLIISPVDELGMGSRLNGVPRPLQSPHPNESPDHQFHGTFNPVPLFSSLSYSDQFNFTIDINGIAGSANEIISGTLYSTL